MSAAEKPASFKSAAEKPASFKSAAERRASLRLDAEKPAASNRPLEIGRPASNRLRRREARLLQIGRREAGPRRIGFVGSRHPSKPACFKSRRRASSSRRRFKSVRREAGLLQIGRREAGPLQIGRREARLGRLQIGRFRSRNRLLPSPRPPPTPPASPGRRVPRLAQIGGAVPDREHVRGAHADRAHLRGRLLRRLQVLENLVVVAPRVVRGVQDARGARTPKRT